MKGICTVVIIFAMLFGMAAQQGWAKPKLKVAWSIYAGWMPWDYAGHSGILKKWADTYGIEIQLVRMDYLPSIEAYVAKQVDACVMTNMECLDMPAASGIDSTVVIVGDYSNGNDAILVRDNLKIKGLKGQKIYLAELSVSHYLLARCLEMNGLKESEVKLINTSDSDIGPVFLANKDQKVVITWNPIVMQIEQTPGVSKIFTSSDIPGEIIDMMVVNTNTLRKHPELGKALTGAWYEIMGIMSKRGVASDKALTEMAKSAGCSLTEYKAQLKTTAMFYTAQNAVEFTESQELKKKMDFVRQFCFKHGLLGENAPNVDVVGIQYPDGSIQGDPKSVTFRFDTTYMKMAAQGKLKTK
ncbi:MAG: ABC transporter substrate-binding protein [Candidatus Aminicenantes bacterium]|nr:ABC transporter substrate-binding protein [Candidatus Aminicenantes bacterium]NIM79962.1 ABC transporter substrate-binding protein [Candidatus Aminicenantes bacterium]NIN19301.1 ABC transporter substrate-binding protein [Candidatus Aminicenantes bacterium]NIN43204.1 ABC transporter substrate-binding protein [Candidatus Aminicenantes bacterium]NIN85943.1 ABC transporter substrate-binding protein [Candidatus Aminicenantes bacterium]